MSARHQPCPSNNLSSSVIAWFAFIIELLDLEGTLKGHPVQLPATSRDTQSLILPCLPLQTPTSTPLYFHFKH